MSELSQTEPEIARKLYELINPSDAITFWATPIEAAIIADKMLDAPYFVKDADTGEAPKVSDLEARYNEIWCDAKKISSYAEAYRSFVIGKPSERCLYDEAIKRMTADDAKKFRTEHHASRRSSINDICKSCWEAGDRIALCHPEPSRDTPTPHNRSGH